MTEFVLLSLAALVAAVLFLPRRRRSATAGEFAPLARLFSAYRA